MTSSQKFTKNTKTRRKNSIRFNEYVTKNVSSEERRRNMLVYKFRQKCRSILDEKFY